jgi:hypothetical protein
MKAVIFAGALLLSAPATVSAQNMSACSPSRCFEVGLPMGLLDATHTSAACNGDPRYAAQRLKICEVVTKKNTSQTPTSEQPKKRP